MLHYWCFSGSSENVRKFGEGLSGAVKQLPGGVDEALGSLLGILVLESLLRNFEAKSCILWDR